MKRRFYIAQSSCPADPVSVYSFHFEGVTL